MRLEESGRNQVPFFRLDQGSRRQYIGGCVEMKWHHETGFYLSSGHM